MDTTPALPPLLPAASADASVAGVVEAALQVLHPVLDALRAGPLSQSGRTGHVLKGDGSPVTPVDVEVDERLTAALTGRFPTHDVVSEELDAVPGDHEWHWVVDPIDGTSNFAAGLPYWCVAIALCHGGVPVLGVVDAPDLDHRWVAVRGGDCRRDGAVVRVRADSRVDDPLTAHLPLFTTLGLLGRARRPAGVHLNPRVLGATALDIALVADGVGVAAASAGGRVWDVAAGAVLVEAAGGASRALAPSPFPLVVGVDHGEVRAPAVHGTSAELVDELVHRLTPAGGSLVP